MKLCIKSFVKGRVQGVFFRAATREQAQALNLTGWVRNLSDGRVEILACGEKENLEKLLSWLQHGPDMAQVTHCDSTEVPFENYTHFKIDDE